MFGYEGRWGRLAVDTGGGADGRAVGRRAQTYAAHLHVFLLVGYSSR